MGSQKTDVVRKIKSNGAEMVPVGFFGKNGTKSFQGRLLDEHKSLKLDDKEFPDTYVNFYRSDDVCATAYFYLDQPESNLPELPPVELRLKNLKLKVWNQIK